MAKSMVVAGRVYTSVGAADWTAVDADGRGAVIHRIWSARHGTFFEWHTLREWGYGYAVGQSTSLTQAAEDAEAAMKMLERGEPAPPPRYRAGRRVDVKRAS